MRIVVALVMLLAVPASAQRLNLRLFGPLAAGGNGSAFPPAHGAGGNGSAFPPAHGAAPKAFHQDFGGGDPNSIIPRGSHADAPIEWGLTSGSFLLGAGVSLTLNVIFNNMANDWIDTGTAAIDARAGTGLLRVAINAPLVGLAVWGLNMLSEFHSVPYLWPYLAGLVCDLIVFGANIGLTAGKVGVPAAPAAPGGAAEGTNVKAAFDVIFLIIGSIAVPLAEVIMAQRVRDPPVSEGGVILGNIEPAELRPSQVDWAPSSAVFSRSF